MEKKIYDLEDRTLSFAISIRNFCKKLSKSISNTEYVKQLVRSSGSIGANYIEANEALGKKDFAMRIKISRKEAKESVYWLKLLDTQGLNKVENEREELIVEATELMKIFSAIMHKTS